MTPTMLVWDGLLIVVVIVVFLVFCSAVHSLMIRPSKLAEQTSPSPRKAQEKKVGDLYSYIFDLKRDIEQASPERKVILQEYLKVTRMKVEQETTKLTAMQVEADRELFERMMDK